MLQAVELPARIPHLDARLADMDADDLPHLPVSVLRFYDPGSAGTDDSLAVTCTGKKPANRKGLHHSTREEGVPLGARRERRRTR